jgi:DNA polymerase-3 subunit epsilon
MVDRHSSFVNYPRSLGGFDAANTELHGITPKDLIGAPVWAEVLPKIVEFVGDDYVVAHPADFDIAILTEACREAEVPLPDLSYFCSRQLAKRALPNLPKYRLADVDAALELNNYTTHDTEANAFVAAMICVEIAERAELETLAHVMGQNAVREGKLGLGRGFATEKTTVVVVGSEVAEKAPVVVVEAPIARVRESPVVEITKPEKAVQPAPVAVVGTTESPLLNVKGQRISFVGGFDLADRTAAKERISEQGGKYLKNVRADTTILVIGVHINPDLEGIVVAKAFNERGSKIQFMTKDEFFGVLGL